MFKKNILVLLIIVGLFVFSTTLASPIGSKDGIMSANSGHIEDGMMVTDIHDTLGIVIAGQMIHVYLDFIVFFIAMFLVVKIGSGRIRYPIALFAVGYLFSGLIAPIFGHAYMWIIALVKSIVGLLGIIWFIQIFGGINLVFHKRKITTQDN